MSQSRDLDWRDVKPYGWCVCEKCCKRVKRVSCEPLEGWHEMFCDSCAAVRATNPRGESKTGDE